MLGCVPSTISSLWMIKCWLIGSYVSEDLAVKLYSGEEDGVESLLLLERWMGSTSIVSSSSRPNWFGTSVIAFCLKSCKSVFTAVLMK